MAKKINKNPTLEDQWRLIAILQEPTPNEFNFNMNDPEDRALYEMEIQEAVDKLMNKPIVRHSVMDDILDD